MSAFSGELIQKLGLSHLFVFVFWKKLILLFSKGALNWSKVTKYSREYEYKFSYLTYVSNDAENSFAITRIIYILKILK